MRARERPKRPKKLRGYESLSYRSVFMALASLTMCLAISPSATGQESVRILATGVFASTLRSLTGPFEAAQGFKAHVTIANAGQVAARLAAGEPADLVMTSSASTQTLAKQGLLVPAEIAIGKMRLGVAVLSGPMPDLTSADSFRSALLAAGKIAYIDPNGGGTSGPFFEKMIASMGIADAVHAKAIPCKTGEEVVRAVASGSASLGMTQASEIISAEDVKFAGFMPEPLNLTTAYSASMTTRSKDSKPAAAFLEFITSPVGSARLREAGWQIDR